MPQHRQPLSLLALCHKQVSNNLVSTCRLLQLIAQDSSATHALNLARRKIRPTYFYMLPGTIRSQLISEVSEILSAPAPDGTTAGAGPAPLYLLALLLASDVKHLKIELCCYYGCSHQAALLKLLSSEGRGLETLELSRSALLRLDRNLLQDALTSANSLTYLMLRNIAGDAILQVIGTSCPNLIVLDISQSRQVTDAGLRYLFLQVELRDKESLSSKFVEVPDPRAGTSSAGTASCSGRGWGRLKILLRLFPWLRANREGENKIKDKTILLEYCEHRNPLCDNLKVLNIANTAVTSAGVLLALHHVPQLESLGEYSHVGRALDLLDKAWSITSHSEDALPTPRFRLTSARSQRTSVRRLQLISLACPALKQLYIFEPYHQPTALKVFPPTLTTLHLMNISLSFAWMSELYDYLSSPHGQNLEDLALRYFPSDESVYLNLSKVLQNCTKLKTFYHDGTDVIWKETTSSEVVLLQDLVSFRVGRGVSAEALTELLRRTPKLKIAHFYSCPDLTDEHLTTLAANSERETYGKCDDKPCLPPNLECFYIYEASRVTAPAVVNLLASCDKLVSTGNLSNWGIDCEGIHSIHNTVLENNLNLEINSGSHWYCSKCFMSL